VWLRRREIITVVYLCVSFSKRPRGFTRRERFEREKKPVPRVRPGGEINSGCVVLHRCWGFRAKAVRLIHIYIYIYIVKWFDEFFPERFRFRMLALLLREPRDQIIAGTRETFKSNTSRIVLRLYGFSRNSVRLKSVWNGWNTRKRRFRKLAFTFFESMSKRTVPLYLYIYPVTVFLKKKKKNSSSKRITRESQCTCVALWTPSGAERSRVVDRARPLGAL